MRLRHREQNVCRIDEIQQRSQKHRVRTEYGTDECGTGSKGSRRNPDNVVKAIAKEQEELEITTAGDP